MFFDYPKLEIELTKHCDFKCYYCGAKAFNFKKPVEIDFEYLSFLIKILKKNKKLPNIILSGGEPTLHSKFFKILEILSNFEVFLITNFKKLSKLENTEINNLNTNIIFSIHLPYLNEYLHDNFFENFIKIFNIIIDQNKNFQFQFVLPQYSKLDLKIKNKLLSFINKYKIFLKNSNTYVHYQFIIDHDLKSENKFKNINLDNIKQYQELLKPFDIKPIFFDFNHRQKYFEILNFYLKNNFSMKNKICNNNNYKLTHDFRLILESDKNIELYDLKKNPFKIKETSQTKIMKCSFDFCDFQICGYCNKK